MTMRNFLSLCFWKQFHGGKLFLYYVSETNYEKSWMINNNTKIRKIAFTEGLNLVVKWGRDISPKFISIHETQEVNELK